MSQPQPISPYGELKLAQEGRARAALEGHLPLVIGRLANLYGPRHNMAKGQGLIPQLCLASVRRAPLNLYVSMDTVRDYIYVDDAAAYAWSAVRNAIGIDPDHAEIVIIASGQPTTVAEVIATVQGVTHRKVPLALGTHPSSVHQAIDLRLTPTPIDDNVEITPLANGIKRVFEDMAGRVNA
jgi:UDP-glucose 4-epimerase